MKEIEFIHYVCPFCKGSFEREVYGYYCENCDRRFPVKEGIPILTDSVNCWDFQSIKSKQLLTISEERGWSKAIQEVYGYSDYGFWISDVSRGCGVLLTSINKKSRVLDAGCGWGALSLFAAPIADEVHAIDSTFDAVKFLAIRTRQEGIENICPAVGDLLKLPFPEDYFDIVLLNGVLEWIPFFEESTSSPYHIQLSGLREVKRVLKHGGEIYLGIENRYALKYFLGARDEHTGLPFVTILPRRLASAVSRLSGKGPYRNYTYSLSGLKKLFAKSVLKFAKVYLPLKSYREINYIVDLNDLKAQAFGIDFLIRHMNSEGIKNRLYYLFFLFVKVSQLYRLGFFKRFGFSFIMIFKK